MMTYKQVDENGGQISLIDGALDGANIAKVDTDGRKYSSFGRVTEALSELASLRQRVAAAENAESNQDLAYYIEQYAKDKEIIAALRARVAKLERACKQVIADCKPLLSLLSWLDDDDVAVEMVENIANTLGAATAAGGEFTEAADTLLETKRELWQKMADQGGE